LLYFWQDSRGAQVFIVLEYHICRILSAAVFCPAEATFGSQTYIFISGVPPVFFWEYFPAPECALVTAGLIFMNGIAFRPVLALWFRGTSLPLTR
jgi:hypothetical protein